MKKQGRIVNRRGFTLIEMLVTIVVLGICISLLCSLFYSLYIIKNNTFADADTQDAVSITDDYLSATFSYYDKTDHFFEVVNYSQPAEGSDEPFPVDDEMKPTAGQTVLVFYNASGKAVFSIYYYKDAENGKYFLVCRGAEDNGSVRSDFTYTLTKRLSGLEFSAFGKDGKEIKNPTAVSGSSSGTVLKCKIVFTDTKGKESAKTVILSRKTQLPG